jgi:hypothetical protein
LRRKAHTYVRAFVGTIDSLLGGSIAGDPDRSGETLMEEKLNSGKNKILTCFAILI